MVNLWGDGGVPIVVIVCVCVFPIYTYIWNFIYIGNHHIVHLKLRYVIYQLYLNKTGRRMDRRFQATDSRNPSNANQDKLK